MRRIGNALADPGQAFMGAHFLSAQHALRLAAVLSCRHPFTEVPPFVRVIYLVILFPL